MEEMNKNDVPAKVTGLEASYEINLKMDPTIYPVIPLTEILKVDRIHFAKKVKTDLAHLRTQTGAAFQHVTKSVSDSVQKSITAVKENTHKTEKKEEASVLEVQVNETAQEETVEMEESQDAVVSAGEAEVIAEEKKEEVSVEGQDVHETESSETVESVNDEVHEEPAVSVCEPAVVSEEVAVELTSVAEEVETVHERVDRSEWLKVLAEEAGICRTDKRRSVVEHVLDLFKDQNRADIVLNEISKASSVSNTTVRSVLEELVKKDLLVKETTVSYALSPSVLKREHEVVEPVHEQESTSLVEETPVPETTETQVVEESVRVEQVNKTGSAGYCKAVLIREVNDGDLLPKYVEEYSGDPAKVSWKGRFLDPVGNMMEQAKSGVHTSILKPFFLTVLKYGSGAFFMLYSLSVLLNKAPFSFARMTFTDASSIWMRILFFGMLTEYIVNYVEILMGGGKDMKRFCDIEAEGAVVLAVLFSISGICLQFSWVVSLVVFFTGLGVYRILHTYSLELAVRTNRTKTMWISLVGTLIGVALVVLWFSLVGGDIVRIVNSFVHF